MAMRLKVQRIGEGLHPSEVVIQIRTSEGLERMVVDGRSLIEDSLGVGYPVQQRQEQYLVELPQETMSGAWRVWVPRDEVIGAMENVA